MVDASSQGWMDAILGLDEGMLWLLLVIAMGCGMGLILGLGQMIGSTIASVHKNRSEMILKREMLDRGMSADEIAKVIAATGESGIAEKPGPTSA